MKTEIIYEDKDIMVVRKPAGLATQTAKVGQQDVVSELKNYLRQPYLGVIHRLDQPVEGLLVFAKNRNAAAGLTAQLQKQGEGGTLHKRYYAVICGKPSENEGRFVDYLYKDESGKAVVIKDIGASGKVDTRKDIGASGMADTRKDIGASGMADTRKDIGASGKVDTRKDVGVSEMRDAARNMDVSGKADAPKAAAASGAKRAILSYRILQVIDSPAELTLAEISLETGRFHQIRAQMAYHGYPLLGDVKYGDDGSKNLSQRLCVKNVALCACHLEFVHPLSKKNLCFRTEPQGQAFSFFDYFN